MTLPQLRSHRRFVGASIALVLGVALGLAPPAARPALAASPLRLAADAVYTLDPSADRVHVAVSVHATSLKPNSDQFVYYYRNLGFAVQPEAKAVTVSDGGGALSTTTNAQSGYLDLTVRLRANLYYQQTATFTIRYDLVGGAPRSRSRYRIGAAFATFDAWAWGDPGRSTVQVRTPAGFSSQVDGGPMSVETAPSGQVLKANP